MSAASMATETVEKGSTGIISGVEKMLGKGKTVTKAVGKAATSDKAKTAGKTAVKVAGKTGKVAGKTALGVASLGGSLLSGGAKGVSSLLGSSGGLSSLLKTGSIIGVLALLTNKKAMSGMTSLVSGATGALSNTASNISKGSTATSFNTESAVNQQVSSQSSVANSNATGTSNSNTLASTGSLAKDKYAQTATKNLSTVVSNNQPAAQNQQDVSRDELDR